MPIFKNQLLARCILAVLGSGLFFQIFAISNHFAPKTERQLITLNHQVRRVLMRAERENLRSSAAFEEGIRIDPPQEFGPASPSLEIAASRYKIPAVSRSFFNPASSILDASPVLNF